MTFSPINHNINHMKNACHSSKCNYPEMQTSSSSNNSRKIFVGGIPQNSTKSGLISFFSSFGQISNVVLPKGKGGSIKGFCIVQFGKEEVALKVISLRELKLSGKLVSLKACMPVQQANQQKASSESLKVFVSGFKQGANEEKTKLFFSTFGQIEHVRLIVNPRTGTLRGFGYVKVFDRATFSRIISIKVFTLNGQALVAEASIRSPRGQRIKATDYTSHLLIQSEISDNQQISGSFQPQGKDLPIKLSKVASSSLNYNGQINAVGVAKDQFIFRKNRVSTTPSLHLEEYKISMSALPIPNSVPNKLTRNYTLKCQIKDKKKKEIFSCRCCTIESNLPCSEHYPQVVQEQAYAIIYEQSRWTKISKTQFCSKFVKIKDNYRQNFIVQLTRLGRRSTPSIAELVYRY